MTFTTQFDLSYGDHPRLQADVFTPKRNPTGTTILFWHGGSWRSGDKKTYRFVGKSLARLGYQVVIPNYRLYPDVTFPVFAEDAAMAIEWTRRELGATQIVAMGHSAGAHIAAVVALYPSYLAARGGAPVDGFIGLSGPYSFQPARSLRPVFGDQLQLLTALPQHLPSTLIPPTLLVHGQIDLVVATRNSKQLVVAIRQHGGRATLVLYPFLSHFTMLAPFLIGWWTVPGLRKKLAHFITSL